MKKIILLFGMLSYTFIIAEESQCPNIYRVKDDGVYYQCQKIEKADKESFRDIGGIFNYAKDKKHVYYAGEIIKKADLKTFEVVEIIFFTGENGGREFFALDKKRVYLNGKEILGADPKTFETLESGWARDKNNVYLDGVKQNIDGITFEYNHSESCISWYPQVKIYDAVRDGR